MSNFGRVNTLSNGTADYEKLDFKNWKCSHPFHTVQIHNVNILNIFLRNAERTIII